MAREFTYLIMRWESSLMYCVVAGSHASVRIRASLAALSLAFARFWCVSLVCALMPAASSDFVFVHISFLAAWVLRSRSVLFCVYYLDFFHAFRLLAWFVPLALSFGHGLLILGRYSFPEVVDGACSCGSLLAVCCSFGGALAPFMCPGGFSSSVLPSAI